MTLTRGCSITRAFFSMTRIQRLGTSCTSRNNSNSSFESLIEDTVPPKETTKFTCELSISFSEDLDARKISGGSGK